MTNDSTGNVTEVFERLLAAKKQEKYVLRLYVTGMTARSMNSIEALKTLCEQFIPGRYELEVVNLLEHMELAELNQVVAAPTLVKLLPLPVQRLVGDLTKSDRLILMLQ